MKINVVLYGVLKQDAGAKHHTLDEAVRDSSDVVNVRRRFPRYGAESVAFVVRGEIVDPDYMLRDGDQACCP
jgi:molybdopterin converting factor small subunit